MVFFRIAQTSTDYPAPPTTRNVLSGGGRKTFLQPPVQTVIKIVFMTSRSDGPLNLHPLPTRLGRVLMECAERVFTARRPGPVVMSPMRPTATTGSSREGETLLLCTRYIPIIVVVVVVL